MHGRVACDHKQVPVERHGRRIAAFFAPAQNLPVLVLGAWVRATDRLAFIAAFDVVGQRAIHLAILGADHDPFRAVHACGFHDTGSHARMNQHFGLIVETGSGVQAILAVGQFDPLAFAFRVIRVAVTRVELRDVQGAVVQQVAVGFGVLVIDLVAADELVDELATLVIAHVHHGAPALGLGERRVLMLEAPERRALDRRGLGIERVDLHHPAVTVHFVGVFRNVEARVVRVPVDLLAGGHDAVALHARVELLLRVAATEAIGEVLLTGQVRAPRRLAAGAVLEGPQRVSAALVGVGLEPVVTGSRAAQVDWRVAMHATVVA